jgi:hypothetical protein
MIRDKVTHALRRAVALLTKKEEREHNKRSPQEERRITHLVGTDSVKILEQLQPSLLEVPRLESAYSWEKMFERLFAYVGLHGHCNVEGHQDLILAKWVELQKHKRSDLTEDQILQLTVIGLTWTTT